MLFAGGRSDCGRAADRKLFFNICYLLGVASFAFCKISFSPNSLVIPKAENINLYEKSTSPKLMRLQKSTFKCAIRGSNPGHPD